jgi:2-polyprenyl-3-methyl-5-hydroxy-6-metoxy-1,4-benzoquinol methylase
MPPCPICADLQVKRFLCKVNIVSDTEFDLVECAACGVIYFAPMPSVQQLQEFYSAAYYDHDKWREEGKGMAFAKRLMKWRTAGNFLDVGCAAGFFINGIQKHSQWRVYGTDFGESAVRYARETLNLDVRHGDLADVHFPDAFFDYVHVNNVLEHVLEPVSLLKECRRIVKPDGIFFLSVPNGFNDSLDLIDFWKEEHKPARSKNGHIFFFADRTLHMLFDRIGFTLQTEKTYSLKRGFRSIGYLPRKKDWKTDLYPRTQPQPAPKQEISIAENARKHSDFYYKYRFIQGNLQMIPGLHKFGLDFLFILRPK